VQRLERFWTLACVLASRDDPALDTSGVRGIRYVEAAIARLDDSRETSTAANFRLLSRQLTYGMVGIYGTVADGLRLVTRDTLTLGADLGWRLGQAFVDETGMPPPLKRAVVQGDEVGLASLKKWGARAHLDGQTGPGESAVLGEVMRANDVRRRMCELLRQYPARDDEAELGRLARVSAVLESSEEHPDLQDALRAILAFEDCYRIALLVFSRLLWFSQGTTVTFEIVAPT
jgi:hypothetical protein